jgi:selenocysteine lyase/cysteine desulfurase
MSAGPAGGIDVARARADTPGCADFAHFNNAGAALIPDPVLRATAEHQELEARIGGYEAAERAAAAYEHTYDAVAQMIGAHRDEVALVDSATRAWQAVFYAIDFKPGDRILTGVAEYASNYLPMLQVSRRTGAVIEVIPDDEHGQLSLDALATALQRPARLISLVHVPSQSGLVNPAEEVGRLARAARVTYILDACQSAGQLALNVEAIGCDALSAAGRKYLRAPRGTGFLYVRDSLLQRLEPSVVDFHSATWTAPDRYEVRADARRFELFEANHAAAIGLGVAVDYALGFGLDAIAARVAGLAASLREGLETIPGVETHDPGVRRCGIVTFTVRGKETGAVRDALREHGINVWTSDAGSALLDMRARGLTAVVRASPHYYNSEVEVERLVAEVARLVA